MSKEIKLPVTDDRLDSIGIIMDGNGRWAKSRHLPRSAGHIAGAKIIQNVLESIRACGIHHVTLYAFSTENWQRPEEEVNGIMELVYKYLDTVVKDKIRSDNDFSMRFLGDKSDLPEKLRNKCIEIEEMAKDRPFVCNLALNYGSRDEIVNAVNLAIKDGVSNITVNDIQSRLYTAHSPDPDLIIRTGGEFRLSNFLLWQAAYSEIYVVDTLWPDFSREDIVKAIEYFYSKKRRFGGIEDK